MRRPPSALRSRSNGLTWAFVPERQGGERGRFPLNWTGAQSLGEPLSDGGTPHTPFSDAARRSTKTAVGSCRGAGPGRFQGPYGNSVLCPEKVSDNSDLNRHMRAVNGPEGTIPQSDPQHMGPPPKEAFPASALPPPGISLDLLMNCSIGLDLSLPH